MSVTTFDAAAGRKSSLPGDLSAELFPYHGRVSAPTVTRNSLEHHLEDHRVELGAYCYRMLGSPFDAQDAVQETFLRAWRAYDRFEGRSSLRSWLYKIATNVCLDLLRSVERRTLPTDLGPAREPVAGNLRELPETTWLEPVPDRLVVAADGDPAEVAAVRDSVRLAFVAALGQLPPRQRAALILCEVLQWKAGEAAELLDTTVASVNSALQRARATLQAARQPASAPPTDVTEVDHELLARYVRAFEAYDMTALTALIAEDAVQSMPPYDLWLSGRADIFTWWLGPGAGCRGSRLVSTVAANGSPAYGQYKPDGAGSYQPWALQVLEIRAGRISELTFFLSTEALFPLFGLPPRLDA